MKTTMVQVKIKLVTNALLSHSSDLHKFKHAIPFKGSTSMIKIIKSPSRTKFLSSLS